MDAHTLVRIMDNPDAARYVDEVNQALQLGNINTVNRVAGFLGVYIREESVGMRAKQEYQNNQMYRYAPYIGRTFGQLTWEFNYRAFGAWLHSKRPDLLADPMRFVNDPPALAEDRYAVLGALWFWLTHGLNAYADQGNVWQMTQTINGGQNGAAARRQYWDLIRSLGPAVLASPTHQPDSTTARPLEDDDMARFVRSKTTNRVYLVGPAQPPREIHGGMTNVRRFANLWGISPSVTPVPHKDIQLAAIRFGGSK